MCVHRHDLAESTREMAKRGSDDLKKLVALQATLVSVLRLLVWWSWVDLGFG